MDEMEWILEENKTKTSMSMSILSLQCKYSSFREIDKIEALFHFKPDASSLFKCARLKWTEKIKNADQREHLMGTIIMFVYENKKNLSLFQ